MMSVMGKSLVLACCLVVMSSATQDNVLRFLSRDQRMQMAQESQQKESEHIVLSPIGYKDDLPMEEFRPQSTACPGGVTQCPDSSTCCPLRNGQYGCCEGVNAVCCGDGVHCCPSGFKCDIEHSQCISETLGIAFRWVDKKVLRAQPLPPLDVRANNNTCRDNKTVCQRNDTCCMAEKGRYGCCPLTHAVCCSDRQHCCPVGTKCDVVHRRCFREKDGWQQPWVEGRRGKGDSSSQVGQTVLHRAKQAPVPNIVCPGGKTECPSGNTCCKLTSGQWGCCPLPSAVCCSDGVHCCPHGYTCASGHCEKSDDETVRLAWVVKQPAVQSVVCPDGESRCPDGSTCCQLTSGAWGCCPHSQAVCCPDHLHCCPHGYKCNVTKSICQKSDDETVQLPWNLKQPAVQTIVCPGGKSECPDGNTCCKLASGQWGCCPLPSAVCCSDHVHCCPHGYTCTSGSCEKSDDKTVRLPWVVKQPAVQRAKAESVICPDKTECGDNQTCCKLSTGQYGCCPYAKAVCCTDGQHCCPNGYKCNLTSQTCVKGNASVSMLEKQPAKSSVRSVICPGGKDECPDGSTCCKLNTGQYGCCPRANAVCCSDGIHCCPEGTKCDLVKQSCKQGLYSIPWEKKQSAQHREQSVTCPGGQSQCPDRTTCCKLTSGIYGCCPLPDAVCCTDGIHCCPSGYSCNYKKQACTKGPYTMAWVEKQPAQRREQSVTCPGGRSQCPDRTTCCKLTTGDYGCCPLPDAVCCTDGIHCCPSGYSCDLEKQACTKGPYTMAWVEKQPAQRSVP